MVTRYYRVRTCLHDIFSRLILVLSLVIRTMNFSLGNVFSTDAEPHGVPTFSRECKGIGGCPLIIPRRTKDQASNTRLTGEGVQGLSLPQSPCPYRIFATADRFAAGLGKNLCICTSHRRPSELKPRIYHARLSH